MRQWSKQNCMQNLFAGASGQSTMVPWLKQAIACILYWKGIKKQHQGGKIRTQYLQRLAKKGG